MISIHAHETTWLTWYYEDSKERKTSKYTKFPGSMPWGYFWGFWGGSYFVFTLVILCTKFFVWYIFGLFKCSTAQNHQNFSLSMLSNAFQDWGSTVAVVCGSKKLTYRLEWKMWKFYIPQSKTWTCLVFKKVWRSFKNFFV